MADEVGIPEVKGLQEAQRFVRALASDQELAAKAALSVKGKGSAEAGRALAEFARSEGYEVALDAASAGGNDGAVQPLSEKDLARVSGGMDFGVMPPEINSGLMYAGPGSGAMTSAASAWGSLAGELSSSANSYDSVVSQLQTEGWSGPGSSQVAAASPYLQWLKGFGG